MAQCAALIAPYALIRALVPIGEVRTAASGGLRLGQFPVIWNSVGWVELLRNPSKVRYLAM
jgi:hypothetical protein